MQDTTSVKRLQSEVKELKCNKLADDSWGEEISEIYGKCSFKFQ